MYVVPLENLGHPNKLVWMKQEFRKWKIFDSEIDSMDVLFEVSNVPLQILEHGERNGIKDE